MFYRRRKNGSAVKERADAIASSISPSASSLIARGHYTPAEDIIWANDGFYCELPVQSPESLEPQPSKQTTPLEIRKTGSFRKASFKNGSAIQNNLNTPHPSRETIYEEIAKSENVDKLARPSPAENGDASSLNIKNIPDDPMLKNGSSQLSISELYAKVDFDKKRKSRMSNYHCSSPPQSSIDSTNAAAEEAQNNDIVPQSESPTTVYRELPPIPADEESISCKDSSQTEAKQSKESLAIELLDRAIYTLPESFDKT